jgi:hypothetical protein
MGSQLSGTVIMPGYYKYDYFIKKNLFIVLHEYDNDRSNIDVHFISSIKNISETLPNEIVIIDKRI